MRRKLLISSGVFALFLVVVLAGFFVFLNKLTERTPGEYFDSNGARLYYTVQGAGEPVVLIHGMAAQSDLNWRKNGVVDRLAKEFQVITFDLRGHGLSECSHDPEFYGAKMAEDVPRLLDHLGIEKAHVAGYSLGGFIALKVLANHPERVHSAAFCASGWKDPEDHEDLLSPYRPPNIARGTALAPRPAHASVVGLPFTFGFVVDWVRNYVGRRLGDKAAFKACKKAYLGLIVTRDELASMTTPGICFIGTNDGLLPYGRAMHKVQPHFEYVELEGANHITTAMRGEFKVGLQEFFERHPMGRADDVLLSATP